MKKRLFFIISVKNIKAMKKNIFLLFILFFFQPVTQSAHATLVNSNWQKHIIAWQATPIYLDVQDMDGDGDLDVVSTTNRHPGDYRSEVSWFRNNLESGLPWEKFVISSRFPWTNPIINTNGVVIADIDNDGIKDVAVATGSVLEAKGSVYWFRAPSQPSSQWQRFIVEDQVQNSYFKLYALDVDEDNQIDLIVGGEQGAMVLYNPGDADRADTVWTKTTLSQDSITAGSSLHIDDMNEDGKLDILNTHTGNEADDPGNVSWFNITIDNETVLFERTFIDMELIKAFDVNSLDVNSDGRKDVIVSIFREPYIYWYEAPQEAGGTWTQNFVSDTFSGTDLYTGDINSDGQSDFVVSGLFQHNISWFEYETETQSWMEHLIDYTFNPGDISLNDLDGDGDLDVVLAGMGSNKMIWYENKIDE